MLVSVVKTLHRTKTAEQLGDMAAYFLKRDNGKSKIAKGILNRAVEMYPTHPELINFKYALTDDTVAFAKDLDRCINLEPSSVLGRVGRAELLLEQGNKAGAINDLKEALRYAKSQGFENKELIGGLEDMLNSLLGAGRKAGQKAWNLKPLVLSDETKRLNDMVDDYMKKYKHEIDEVLDEKMAFRLSNTNCEVIEISPKEHLLNYIKRKGKLSDLGLEDGQIFYHGTSADAKLKIEEYGFDLSLLDKENISGVFVNGSYNAGCSYFMVPDPSKNLEIL